MLTTFVCVVVEPVVVDLDFLLLVYHGRGVSVDGGLEDGLLDHVSVDDDEVNGVCNKQLQHSIII